MLDALEFVVPDAIIRDVAPTSKPAVIELLVKRLAEVNRLSAGNVVSVTAAILEREKLGSTGIGRGFAVPHAKHDAVCELVAAIGYAPQGIDFDAIDGGDVYTVFLLISPLSRPGDHLRALERISTEPQNEWILPKNGGNSAMPSDIAGIVIGDPCRISNRGYNR